MVTLSTILEHEGFFIKRALNLQNSHDLVYIFNLQLQHYRISYYVKQMCIRNLAYKGTTAYYFDIVR